MTTDTDICNMALDLLVEAPISSIEDNRPVARWLKRNFIVTRNALLSQADWNFAIAIKSLPADSSAPPFGWSYRYTLPGDCLRCLPVTDCGLVEGRPVMHEIIDGKVYTNAGAPLRIRYVRAVDDYSRYPAVFCEALAARLAMKLANWLTGKNSYIQIAEGMYRDAMSRAWLIDAIEGTTPRAADDQWVDAR